ncbi:MAG TPA: Xaa-Pro peptidase family protein [Candidatus Acidoferrales bacterium]|nr:Xaa-Pro peptidase family protein [Candidatus Acidoferrales bacterium]
MQIKKMRVVSILLALSLLISAGIASGRFRQANEEYAARRAKLAAQVDGPVVVFGYTGHEDLSEFALFFQEKNFYYLSGDDEPGGAVLLIPDPPAGKKIEGAREVLYLPARDYAQEKWEGPKMGPDDPGIREKTGFADVQAFANLRAKLEELAKTYSNFYTLLPGQQEEGYPHLKNWSEWLKHTVPSANVFDITPAISAMRQVKSAGELALMRKAIDASIDAQLDAMKRMRPGLYEYQVAARMKEIHEFEGCSREAYAPIVGTGFFSTVLHYSALDAQIKDGDIVVLDVGGEYGDYAADITRTLPANGKYSARQREIYEIVLGAQNAAMAAVKPGATIRGGAVDLNVIAREYINTHGKDLHGEPLGKYYIHGLSHHLGLDVHDPGSTTRPLEAGMVFTIEPGIYIPEENLGVRIEDDVLVTKDGIEVLTKRLPRNPDEVEKAMAEGAKN